MKVPTTEQTQDNATVVVGKLGKPYGVRGWLVLQSFTEPMENILAYQPWFLSKGAKGDWAEVTSVQTKAHKDAFIAQINGIEDRDQAATLTGALIGVPKQALDVLEEDEYLWHDLIGCQVTNLQGVDVGVVRELMETGAHAILCIAPSAQWLGLSSGQTFTRNDSDHAPGQSAPAPRHQQTKRAANVLVPFTAAYVQSVDTKSQGLVIDWQADWA